MAGFILALMDGGRRSSSTLLGYGYSQSNVRCYKPAQYGTVEASEEGRLLEEQETHGHQMT